MTVLSSAETAEQPPRKKLCLSASRQLQSKSYARSQLNPMASPLDQPGIQGYQVIAISVIFSVIIVQLIIYSYVKQAFNEPIDNVDDSDDHKDEKVDNNDKKHQ